MADTVYDEGWEACENGITMDSNPYENAEIWERQEWIEGWMSCFEHYGKCGITNEDLEDEEDEDEDW